jgi:hypothetical protein
MAASVATNAGSAKTALRLIESEESFIRRDVGSAETNCLR